MARIYCAGVLILCAGLAGCGSDFEMEVAPVTGTCKCGGKLITEGYVVFTPKVAAGADAMNSGKSASGNIKKDGTYSLTTYDDGDGAVIGTHEVRLYRPDPEDDEQVQYPFACINRVLEVTVEANDNVIDLDPAEGLKNFKQRR